MHKIFPRAASFLDAAAARPLLPSSSMPALRLVGPFLTTRANPITTRIRSRPFPRCGGGGAASRRGLCCSAEAAGGGDDAIEVDGRVSAGGGAGGRTSPERRQRCRGDAATGSGELLAIPGVGPRNQRKLVEKGFDGVAQLKQLYRDKRTGGHSTVLSTSSSSHDDRALTNAHWLQKTQQRCFSPEVYVHAYAASHELQFFGKSNEKMVEFLQSSVGIIHKNHAESITLFIKESVDEEVKDTDTSKPCRSKRLTFCVEGNISVGKSTFLQRIANETIELRDLVEIVPEPVGKWQDVGPEHFNILDAFYAEPQRYAYTFQNYVFVTRVMQEKESSSGIKPLRLMERSVFSDRMVFVRAVHEAKWMNEMEISIYDSWFDPVVSSLPGLIPDGFIYLRASPDTCHKRMMVRKRSEEGGVSLDYLQGLHEKHESWLLPSKGQGSGLLSVSQLPMHMEGSLHPEIRDRVFFLEGDHMHSSIQKVPALILDCEDDIDFNKDIEAKQQYARQVAKFFEFVKKKNESLPVETSDGDKSISQQIMLPGRGDLWVPGGSPIPKSALQSLEFRRAMSSFISK